MSTAGLSLQQAPPLSVPAGFFLAVSASLIAAGVMLLFAGAAPVTTPWHPQAVALTHIGTIGVLLMGMLGALYQMTPVVAGTPVPVIRLAHGVHALLLAGLACFAWRLLGGPALAMTVAGYSLGLALLVFLLPVGWSLGHAATRNETVIGMRLAVASLAVIAAMGLVMATGYAGAGFPQSRSLWTQVHLTLALLGWVGGLLMSVSWQVVPMFYLAPPAGKTTMRVSLATLFGGLLLVFAVLLTVAGVSSAQWAGAAALPAALTIWVAHPLLTLHGIARRKRRRNDASLLFWRAGLTSALLLVPLAALTLLADELRWPLLFGWFAILGWAGMIMHGMLARIVPFLAWFHRIMPLIGKQKVPSMRGLLSQGRIRIGFVMHLAALLLGAAAIVTQQDILARLAGISLVATGISLGSSLLHVLRWPG